MSSNIDELKKKIIYRSKYRGTKEMDKLLGKFVKKYIDDFGSYAKNTEPIVDLKLTRIESIERYKRCLNNEKS